MGNPDTVPTFLTKLVARGIQNCKIFSSIPFPVISYRKLVCLAFPAYNECGANENRHPVWKKGVEKNFVNSKHFQPPSSNEWPRRIGIDFFFFTLQGRSSAENENK